MTGKGGAPGQALEVVARSTPPRAPGEPVRVVVLGGGFAGVNTAKYLTEMLGRRTDVHVELLSEENYFVFQPLLPEVAAGSIGAQHAVNAIRELVPRAQFRCCVVRSIDLAAKRVLVSQGEGLSLVSVPYDHLVFCLGKVSNFASMPGVAQHALAMKDLGDAFRLRNHVIRCLELADIEPEPAVKAARLTFVVAGGGFSGVETIGELQEMVSRSLKYFRNIAPRDVRFKLIHSGDVLLPEMPEQLGRAAQGMLEARGVEMLFKSRVRAASPGAVYLADGSSLHTRTFICTVGNAPNPIVKHTLRAGNFEEATMNGRPIGTFATDRTLQCVGHAGYWAVGDCAGVPSPDGKGLCPPTAQFAIREAKTCARNILATIDGRAMMPFEFKVLGMLASLGGHGAVAEMMGVRFSGFLAWFAWRGVYLFKLPGWARRVRVALDWALDLVFPRDITQLQTVRPEQLHIHHYEPGEIIIQEGHIGREFYMIESGEVEVLGKGEAGERAQVIATMGPREVFGERALLEDTQRTASVRARGAVDLLVMSRPDFRSMVAQFPVLNDYFEQLLLTRYPKEMADTDMTHVGDDTAEQWKY